MKSKPYSVIKFIHIHFIFLSQIDARLYASRHVSAQFIVCYLLYSLHTQTLEQLCFLFFLCVYITLILMLLPCWHVTRQLSTSWPVWRAIIYAAQLFCVSFQLCIHFCYMYEMKNFLYRVVWKFSKMLMCGAAADGRRECLENGNNIYELFVYIKLKSFWLNAKIFRFPCINSHCISITGGVFLSVFFCKNKNTKKTSCLR
jgi:hypothetical protein